MQLIHCFESRVDGMVIAGAGASPGLVKRRVGGPDRSGLAHNCIGRCGRTGNNRQGARVAQIVAPALATIVQPRAAQMLAELAGCSEIAYAAVEHDAEIITYTSDVARGAV